MTKRITETRARVTATETASGRMLLQIITPGWGSSGYYSPQVLENAATEQVWPAGTHLYADHPSETERYDRPERSVRDLIGTLTEDAHVGDAGALVAEAEVFAPYRPLFTDPGFTAAIGMSIRAGAKTGVGEAEGKKGTIVEALLPDTFNSVDFVTHPGRGGSVISLLESARPELVVERATERGVSEATANDTREALTAAVRTAYADDDNTWAWVRDFDDALVWFDVESPEAMTTYQQGYTLSDAGQATLAAGDPTPVRARTEYVPIESEPPGEESHQPPVIPAGSTQESEEDTMPQIEEAQLRQLEADAGRATTAERERDEAREALAARDRADTINRVIESVEGHQTLSVLERRGLTADVTVTDGTVDEAALRTAVETAVTERAEQAGAGRVSGFGADASTTTSGEITAAESTRSVLTAFRIPATQEG